MTVLDDVLGSLQHMTLLQLLFAFLACMCYAALQGSLAVAGVRGVASAAAAASAAGFVVTGDTWVYGIMLLAFAICGLGVVAAVVWMLGHLLGFSGHSAPRIDDSAFTESLPDDGSAAAAPLSNRPVAAARLATHSR